MQQLTMGEIGEVERVIGHNLPGLYRRLLTAEGYGWVGQDAEIYHPATVWERYASFFDDPTQIFHPYFPFGEQSRKQELWIIDSAAERAALTAANACPVCTWGTASIRAWVLESLQRTPLCG